MDMSIQLNFEPELPKKDQAELTQVGHLANEYADFWKDAKMNTNNILVKIGKWVNHENFKKFHEAIRGHKIYIYGMLALAFPFIAYWEWVVSYEIYEVLLPAAPSLPIIVCIFFGIYISACLGEGTKHFSLLASEDSEENPIKLDEFPQGILDRLYDQKTKRTRKRNWYFHPLTGLLLGGLFLWGIFEASLLRSELLEKAGEPSFDLLINLPVVLYSIELLIGIPTIFVIACLLGMWQMKRLNKKYTRAKNVELKIGQCALKYHAQYTQGFKISHLQDKNGGGRPLAKLEKNKALSQLLKDSFDHEEKVDDKPGQSDKNFHNPKKEPLKAMSLETYPDSLVSPRKINGKTDPFSGEEEKIMTSLPRDKT